MYIFQENWLSFFLTFQLFSPFAKIFSLFQILKEVIMGIIAWRFICTNRTNKCF